MNEITSQEEQNYSQNVPTNTSIDNTVIEKGNSTLVQVNTYSNNGSSYTVSIYMYTLTLHHKTYDVKAAVIRGVNGTYQVDPLDSVHIDYLWIWFFGNHKYGEVDYIYQDYYYDTYAYSGQHFNEAHVSSGTGRLGNCVYGR